MNNNNKPKQSKGSLLPILAILAFLLLRSTRGDPQKLAVIAPLIVLFCVIAVISAARKKGGAKPAAKRSAQPAPARAGGAVPRAGRRGDEAEEAVRCHHSSGKQKYIEQLDGYLSAGLIDRDEYRVLKERYEKLDLPDDYH